MPQAKGFIENVCINKKFSILSGYENALGGDITYKAACFDDECNLKKTDDKNRLLFKDKGETEKKYIKRIRLAWDFMKQVDWASKEKGTAERKHYKNLKKFSKGLLGVLGEGASAEEKDLLNEVIQGSAKTE